MKVAAVLQTFGAWNLEEYSQAGSPQMNRLTAVRYAVVIEHTGENFSAYVLDLPGCVATGQTIAETVVAIREAIEFHLAGMKADGTPIPPPSSRVDYVEVAA